MYSDLEGYVYARELMKAFNLSQNAYKYWSTNILKVGQYNFIRKIDMPDHYYEDKKSIELFNSCLDCKGYIPAAEWMRLLNVSNAYISELILRVKKGNLNMPLEIVENNGCRLIKVFPELEKRWKKNKNIQIISQQDWDQYDETFTVNGFLFGSY